MPILDTQCMSVIEKLPGWRGRIFHSPSLTFGHWDFSAGSSIHEHRLLIVIACHRQEVDHTLASRPENSDVGRLLNSTYDDLRKVDLIISAGLI
jgi:hypothetical protein